MFGDVRSLGLPHKRPTVYEAKAVGVKLGGGSGLGAPDYGRKIVHA